MTCSNWPAPACWPTSAQPPRQGAEGWQITGDPTEAALLTLAGKLGLDGDHELRRLPRGRQHSLQPGAALHCQPASRPRRPRPDLPVRRARAAAPSCATASCGDGNTERLDPRGLACPPGTRAQPDGLRMIGLAMRPLPAPPGSAPTTPTSKGDFILPRPGRHARPAARRSHRRRRRMPHRRHRGKDDHRRSCRHAAVIAARVGLG